MESKKQFIITCVYTGIANGVTAVVAVKDASDAWDLMQDSIKEKEE